MSPSAMPALPAIHRSCENVLGYPVDLVDKVSALEIINTGWQTACGLHVVTLNAEMIIAAQNDQKLDRIVKEAQLIVPDGAGVVWALRLAGIKVNRLPGIDLATAALNMAASEGRRVALIGGRKEILDKVTEILPQQYPGLNIVVACDGYFTPLDESTLVERIALSQPELVLLALGVPKQEYLAFEWRTHLSTAVIIGVGGSFDIWAGLTKRAPESFQRLHLEWLYRLIKEPWRFNRMSSTLPKFAFQVLFQRIHRLCNGLRKMTFKKTPKG